MINRQDSFIAQDVKTKKTHCYIAHWTKKHGTFNEQKQQVYLWRQEVKKKMESKEILSLIRFFFLLFFNKKAVHLQITQPKLVAVITTSF